MANARHLASQLAKHLAALLISSAKTKINNSDKSRGCSYSPFCLVKRYKMIHCYKLNGYNIVLDMASGSVHSVDPVAYDAIEMYESHTHDEIKAFLLEKYSHIPDVTAEEIDELFSDIEALKASGKLFSVDLYENHAFDFKARHTEVKALCLHIAHTCNLTCDYCFAAQGKFHGKSALMSLDSCFQRSVSLLL